MESSKQATGTIHQQSTLQKPSQKLGKDRSGSKQNSGSEEEGEVFMGGESSRHNEPEKTLYERLGGEPAIRLVVDGLYKRIYADPNLDGFFKTTRLERQKEMM